MSKRACEAERAPRGFLMSLLHDVRANTFVMMGMALIPLAGLVGGGLDISRMYILKTRLQHACDAGALAGRRAMGGGTWAYNGYYPRDQAEKFFDANFEYGSFGSDDLERSFTEGAGKVTGEASAEIPMTIMKILGEKTKTIEVTCDAEMRLPNTDVMFVLDSTGSMRDPQPGDSVTKMAALKVAVKCFYEIVARLDTDANCTTGTPSGGTGQEVQIRFGFVPYDTNVNVGRLLKPEWFADSWKYQTRTPRWWVRRTAASASTPYATPTSNGNCTKGKMEAVAPQSDVATGSGPGAVRTIVATTSTAPSWIAGICTGTYTTTTSVYDWREGGFGTSADLFIEWRYNSLPVNVGLLKDGTSWNASMSFQWPVDVDGESKRIDWDGCIEERQTVWKTDYDPIPSDAYDLDIDMVPTGDDATKWAPALNDVIYTRKSTNKNVGDIGKWSRNEAITAENYTNTSAYACTQQSKKLQEWPNAGSFDDYVDSLYPGSNTYHDIGLIWGARLLSPTGLFKSENEYTPKGGEIERHLIFMTDGDACTENYNYTSYGIEWFDRRRTDPGAVPTDGCTTNIPTLTEQVNRRTEGLCTAIKNKNITLWVIAFGSLASSTETRLKNCASSGRYFKATNAAALQQTFKQIADQISMLRLTN